MNKEIVYTAENVPLTNSDRDHRTIPDFRSVRSDFASRAAKSPARGTSRRGHDHVDLRNRGNPLVKSPGERRLAVYLGLLEESLTAGGIGANSAREQTREREISSGQPRI
jgi:hypothetical protein